MSVIVWVDPGANVRPEQYHPLRSYRQIPFVKSCLFRSQAYDFAEAKQFLPLGVQLHPHAADDPVFLPVRARQSRAKPPAIISQFHNQPNVKDVSSPPRR